MVKAVNHDDDATREADYGPGPEPDSPLSDGPLLDLLDALVEERGRVPAAQVLGVNYRTLAFCCDSRRVSLRMSRALLEFRNRVGGETEDGDGDGAPDEGVAALRQRVAELEDENFELRELADEQARQLEELNHRLAGLENRKEPGDAAEVVDAANAHAHVDSGRQDWRPPRRRPGMPDAGVVTLEEQHDEAHAFGPAAPLVAEWPEVRTKMGSGAAGSRVGRTQAAVRRWELEAELLGEYHLTLPPETDPLDESRRKDHVRWRQEAMTDARRELGRAERERLLKRILTFGLWGR